MSDEEELARLNEQFIDACRAGSWSQLSPVLSERFSYVDGATGRLSTHEEYVADLERDQAPRLSIDQVVIRVVEDVGLVSARTSNGTGRHNRYLDVYAREQDGWRCVHATVWPTDPDPS